MDLFYWLVRALRKWFPVGEEQKQFLMHCLIGHDDDDEFHGGIDGEEEEEDGDGG